MEEIPKVKVIYGKEEFEMSEQELDRIVAIASKKLRNELISMRLGFGMPIKRNELKNERDVKVLKDGYESELYSAMSETLAYAIENGDLDNYLTASEEKRIAVPEIEMNFPRVDRDAINALMKIRNESFQEILAREIHKMLEMTERKAIFY